MSSKYALHALFALLVSLSVAAQADTFISERFTGYPDNALISAHPAGPALGLAGDWSLDPENFFYVNRTEYDLGAATGKATYDMPWDDNGARTAQRSTSTHHVLLSGDSDTFHASFRILPARSDGHMIFGLTLDRLDGGGQTDVSFGMIDGHFIIGNGGVDVDITGGAPTVTEMRVVLRVEYRDSGSGPDDSEVVTLWVDPADEFSTPIIDRVPIDLLNSGGARITAVSMRGGHMAGQPAYFDDLLVGSGFEDVVTDPPMAGLTNDLGMNGLFYDPNKAGHGFNFIVHAGGLTIFYFGHTASGERLWLISEVFEGDLEYETPIELAMLEVLSGVFGHPQLTTTAWGTITLELADCDTGHASFDGIDGSLEMDFIRLSGMPGIWCQ
jgi:hypothetical protein